VRRRPDRAAYDAASLHAVLDEALVCHVGFVVAGQPFVIPTTHARVGDVLYLHGSPASRMLRAADDEVEVCVTVTLVDALVLARSWMHHSVNYRSAVVFGRAGAVTDPATKLTALRALVEHVVPGRSTAARAPSAKELAGTLVLGLPIEEASVKIRTGPPIDDDNDYDLDVWAGVLPLPIVPGGAIHDPRLPATVPVPLHVRQWRPGGVSRGRGACE
jgi:nitroimidazol reductase NimA-like FMN-containing flavoprotein (pyridoxamine 5'-phosphate oxidase superfamily)